MPSAECHTLGKTPPEAGTKGASMVTMSEVAKAAGVSRATASYALRGDPRIAPDTAQKVLNAANELKYTANLSARSLRSGHNGVIGVAIFELDRPYPSEMSAAISREATKHGLQTIVQQTSISKDSEIGILKKVTSQLCDGMIFSPSNVSDQEIRILAGGKPIVLLDALSHSPMFDTINTPCETGAQAAIDHLINVGCRNILVIGAGGPLEQTDGTIAGEHQDDATYDVTQPMLAKTSQDASVSDRRAYGCLQSFAEHGMPITTSTFLPMPRWDEDAARSVGRQIARAMQGEDATSRVKQPGMAPRPVPHDVDGIFCMTDTIALGVMRGLADCGVNVPRDVKVIGFDGISEGEYSIPSLTTISTDLGDLAKQAVSQLLDRINNPDSGREPEIITARYQLIERESTNTPTSK